MFKVGQKIVCIDASPARSDCTRAMPLRLERGTTYTVRSIHTEPELEGYGVRLDELLNPSVIWADGSEKEWSYDARRFRPLVESPTLATAHVNDDRRGAESK